MELEEYLRGLAERVHDALGDSLRGIYLTGSAAVGAYRRGASDVDVLVAVDGATDATLDAVAAQCAHDAYPCPAEKLELVVYETTVLQDPGARPQWSLNLNTGRGVHHIGRDPAGEPAHWFVLDLSAARRHAFALVGPAPVEVIGEIDADVVAAAFADQVGWYEEHEPGEAAEVAARRARHWSETGDFATKGDVSEDEANAS